MKSRPLSIWIYILITMLLLAGCDSLTSSTGTRGDVEPILASGVIEADQINISSSMSGKIIDFFVEEGADVLSGDLLFSLEDDLLQIQKAQAASQLEGARSAQESAQAALAASQAFKAGAEASLNAAQIQYKQVLGQARVIERENSPGAWNVRTPFQIDLPAWFFHQPEMITAAEHIVDQAWDDYQTELASYHDLLDDQGNDEYHHAEQRLANAQAAFLIAVSLRDQRIGYAGTQQIQDEVNQVYDAALDELESAQEGFDLVLSDPQFEEILLARAKVSVARERYDLALDYLSQLYRGAYALEVQAADALVTQAQAGLDQAEALVAQAETGLAAADSGVLQAQSALDLVNLQLDKTQVYAPLAGVVLSQAVEAGEMIGAGYTALTIGDLAHLTVTVYIPENRYGQISLGDMADLSIDSYPEQVFVAEVFYISDKAEYTPRNVQTQEERQNTVYAVKLRVVDEEGMLIPGMPADVVLTP